MPDATRNADRPAPLASIARGAGSLRLSALVNIGFECRLAQSAARFLHQVGLDEAVDVAVENAIDVADLILRPVILDELVGVQHVTANLVAERDVLLDAADLLELG